MAGVTGIGGIFFTAQDPEGMAAWYRDQLSIPVGPDGHTQFYRRERDDPDPDHTEYGRFGWAMDPGGNRIELWESPVGQ